MKAGEDDLRKIRMLFKGDKLLRMEYISRSKNVKADEVAKQGI